MSSKTRAFELDALRGFSILMMVCHHFMFDVRYFLNIDAFQFQETFVFINILRPFFVCVFLFVSGICSIFSKSNLKRSARMFVAAIIFSLAMAVISTLMQFEMYIFFNILHLIALGTFLVWIFDFLEMQGKKYAQRKDFPIEIIKSRTDVLIMIFAILIFLSVGLVEYYDQQVSHYFLLPLGILPRYYLGMSDYLPVIPWLGIFLIGCVAGRTVYRNKTTIFPGVSKVKNRITLPFEWIGRHALIVYLLHQPVLLGILFAGRYLGLW